MKVMVLLSSEASRVRELQTPLALTVSVFGERVPAPSLRQEMRPADPVLRDRSYAAEPNLPKFVS